MSGRDETMGGRDGAVSGRDGALSLGKETFGRTGADQAVRVLSQREKGLTRPLYEGCFPEDGPALTDFYYREKMADNTVLCRFSPGGVPLGMLCLNPYRVRVFDQERSLSYIVAVATDSSCRRQGIMRSVLQEALSLLRQRGEAFTFLKPANPAYYTPFGFSWISERRPLRRSAAAGALKAEPLKAEPLDHADSGLLEETAEAVNRVLGDAADVCCLRDVPYLRTLLRELTAGGGAARLFREPETGAIAGAQFLDYPDTADDDSRLILPARYTEAAGPQKPFLMGRITHLPAFLSLFRLKADPSETGDLEENADRDQEKEGRGTASAPVVLSFYYEDPLLAENSGAYRWTLTSEGSQAEKLSEEETGRHGSQECAAADDGAVGAAADAGHPPALPKLRSETLMPWLFGMAPLPETCRRAFPAWTQVRQARAWFDEET